MKPIYIKNIEEFVGLIAMYGDLLESKTEHPVNMPYIFKHEMNENNNLVLTVGYFANEDNVISAPIEMIGSINYKINYAGIPITLSPKCIKSIKNREWLGYLKFPETKKETA